MARTRRLARTEVIECVCDGLNANDEVRDAGLEALRRLTAEKARLRDRERARLVAKHGARSDTVAALNELHLAEQRMMDELLARLRRRESRSATPHDGGAVLHGRVLVPLPGVTVSAIDDSGKTLGEQSTDRGGYFRFQLLLPESTLEGTPSVRIRITDAEGSVLRSDGASHSLLPGHTDYLEVVLVSAP